MATMLDHSPVATYRNRLDHGAMPSTRPRPSDAQMGSTAFDRVQGGGERDASPSCSPSPRASPRVQSLGSGVGFIDWSGAQAQKGARRVARRSPFPRSASEAAPASPPQQPAQAAQYQELPAQPTQFLELQAQAAQFLELPAQAWVQRERRHSESSVEAFGAPAASQGVNRPVLLLSRLGSGYASTPCLSRAGSAGCEGLASPHRSALKNSESVRSAGASPRRSPKQVQFSETVAVRVYKTRPTRLAKCASIDSN